MKIGDKVWIFDSNHRIYEDENGNRTVSPWFRGYFIEKYIYCGRNYTKLDYRL